jgi:ATP-dependent DNA ligase
MATACGCTARPGNDLTDRFSLIVEALARLRARSIIIDGEAVCCGDDGVPSLDHFRYRRHDASVVRLRSDRAGRRRSATRTAASSARSPD